jgi:hypothetical protein
LSQPKIKFSLLPLFFFFSICIWSSNINSDIVCNSNLPSSFDYNFLCKFLCSCEYSCGVYTSLTCISRLRTHHIFKTKTITKVKKIQTRTPYAKCFSASEYALQIGTLVQHVQVNILGGFSKKYRIWNASKIFYKLKHC